MRNSIWAALALSLAALGPVACDRAEAPADTSPEAPDGVEVSNGRLMLPAVGGNPGAVYFDLANNGERDLMIRAASVQGAGSTAMHTTEETGMQEILQIMAKAGETTKFEPGGYHLMANDLAETVVAGGEAEVTVTFVGGDKVSFPAQVRAAGDER